MTWMDQLRFGVAKVLLNGVEFAWRGRLNFGDGFYAEDDPVLRATTIKFQLAAGAETGDIAVASSGSPKTWAPSRPATILRTGYDTLHPQTAVPHAAGGTTWMTLLYVARADICANNYTRSLSIKWKVKQITSDPQPADEATSVVVYTRRDSYADTLSNKNEGSSNSDAETTITGTVDLPAAFKADADNGTLSWRIRRGTGASLGYLFIEVLRHNDQERYVGFELYLGNSWT